MWSNNATPMRLKVGGFTLVELMVALVIGLILIAGALKVFEGNRATYQQAQHLSELQNNMRFVTEVFAREIRGATAIDYEKVTVSGQDRFILKITSNRPGSWCSATAGQEIQYFVMTSPTTGLRQLSCRPPPTATNLNPNSEPIIEGLKPSSHLAVNGYDADGVELFTFDKENSTLREGDINGPVITSLTTDMQENVIRLELELDFETTPGGQDFKLNRTLKFNVTLRNRALQEYSS